MEKDYQTDSSDTTRKIIQVGMAAFITSVIVLVVLVRFGLMLDTGLNNAHHRLAETQAKLDVANNQLEEYKNGETILVPTKEITQDMIDEWKKKVDEVNKQNSELEEDNTELEEKNEEIINQYDELKECFDKLDELYQGKVEDEELAKDNKYNRIKEEYGSIVNKGSDEDLPAAPPQS